MRGQVSLSYIHPGNTKSALTSLHQVNGSLRLEYDFISARAAAERQYAESLEKIAGDLRTALRHDDLMEYGPHKDLLWYLSEEATQVARFHRRVSADLTDQQGPAEALKRYRAESNHKKVTNLATKTSQETEDFHQRHKKVYGSLFSDIISTQQIAEKYEKRVAKTLVLGEQVRRRNWRNRGVIYNRERARLGQEETELLSHEAEAVCLSDQHNSKAKKIHAALPDTRQKSEDFMKEIMAREQARLGCVLAQVSIYLKSVRQKDSESEEYMKMMEETKEQLLALDTSAIVWSWRHTHSDNIDIPQPIGTGQGSSPGIVTTLLKTPNRNSYGHKDTIADMFRVDSAKQRGTSPVSNEPSSFSGQSAQPACENHSRDSTTTLRPESRRSRRSRTPLPQSQHNSPAGPINLEDLDSDIEEDTGKMNEVNRADQQRQNHTNVQPFKSHKKAISKYSQDRPTPKQKKDAWVGGFDSSTSDDSL